MAVPTGVALIGIGISMWREQRKATSEAAPGVGLVEHLAA
jgi:hypothetical protein